MIKKMIKKIIKKMIKKMMKKLIKKMQKKIVVKIVNQEMVLYIMLLKDQIILIIIVHLCQRNGKVLLI